MNSFKCNDVVEIRWKYDNFTESCPLRDLTKENGLHIPIKLTIYQSDAYDPMEIIGFEDCSRGVFFWRVPNVLPAYYTYVNSSVDSTTVYEVSVEDLIDEDFWADSEFFTIDCPVAISTLAPGDKAGAPPFDGFASPTGCRFCEARRSLPRCNDGLSYLEGFCYGKDTFYVRSGIFFAKDRTQQNHVLFVRSSIFIQPSCASSGGSSVNQLLGCNCSGSGAACNAVTSSTYLRCASNGSGLCVFDQSLFPPTTTGAKIVVTRLPRTRAPSVATTGYETTLAAAAAAPMSLSTIIIICVASFVALGLLLLVAFWLYMRRSSIARQQVLMNGTRTQSMQFAGSPAVDINQRVRSMQIHPNQVCCIFCAAFFLIIIIQTHATDGVIVTVDDAAEFKLHQRSIRRWLCCMYIENRVSKGEK